MDHEDSATSTGVAIAEAVDEKHEVQSEKESKPSVAGLSDQEKDIIDKQLTAPTVTVGYFSLFRYATRKDIVVMVVALAASIAAGAVMPLMTVSNLPSCSWD
jgi:ATP-binding cassette subfamily B (MDR/TAP) protein 1